MVTSYMVTQDVSFKRQGIILYRGDDISLVCGPDEKGLYTYRAGSQEFKDLHPTTLVRAGFIASLEY